MELVVVVKDYQKDGKKYKFPKLYARSGDRLVFISNDRNLICNLCDCSPARLFAFEPGEYVIQ